jgi:hypothetical protein
VSHVVLAHFEAEQVDDIVFTAYCPEHPEDVLTETMTGSGRAVKDDLGAVWFECGNFTTPWHDNQEIILIIETYHDNKTCFAALDFTLDATVDIQKLDNITLIPIPEPAHTRDHASWSSLEDDNILGYSLYDKDQRVNQTIISSTTYPADHEAFLRPVIRGGFETVYSSQGCQNAHTGATPLAYAFSVTPNPCHQMLDIRYQVPAQTEATITVYDATGRIVKQWNHPTIQQSNHIVWEARDNAGRAVSSGVYFVRFRTDEHQETAKLQVIK